VPLAILPTSVGGEDGIVSYSDLFERLLDRIAAALRPATKP